MKRNLLLFLFAILLGINSVRAQEVQKITIQDAIDLALENNYALKQAKNNLGLAEESIISEYADFLPSVSSSLSGSRTSGQQFIFDRFSEGLDPFVNITSQSLSGNLRANINLFNGFNNILTLRISEESKLSRQESLQRAEESVIFNTASRYLQVLLDKELLEIAKENLVTSEKQLEQIGAQVEVGSRPAVDRFNQEATVANDELTVTQRENSLALNRILLIRQLQIDPLGNYEFLIPDVSSPDEYSVIGYELEALIDDALKFRSDIRSEQADIKTLEYQLLIAKSSLLPTISASAGVSSRYSDQYTLAGTEVSFSDQFFDQQVNKSLGISFSLPLFNNWNRMYNIQSSQVQLKNARLNLDNSRLQVVQEVTQAYNDYISYAKQLEAAQKSLIASEKAFETQQERYNVGASTLIELSQAQASYVQAQSSYTQAQYNLIFQEKLVDYYLGKLSGDDIQF